MGQQGKQTPASAQSATPHPAVGRTSWDAAVEISAIFGRALPLILVAVAIAFGAYKYFELAQKASETERNARAEAAKEYQSLLSTANQRLTETYTALGGITRTQIDNIGSLLRQIQQTQKNADDLRKQVEQQQQQLDERGRQLKFVEERKATVDGELKAMELSFETATATLGALGSLVDEAPDLLRAIATTDALQIVLQKSDNLLGELGGAPEVQQNRVRILLAFAGLQGFIGATDKQEKLARGALALIEQLRKGGGASPAVDTAQATAISTMAEALAAQEKHDEAISAFNMAINQIDALIGRFPRDLRLIRRKAEMLEQLGKTVYRARSDRNGALKYCRLAVELWKDLLQKDPDNLAHTVGLAWSRFAIGAIEIDQQVLDTAMSEYEESRKLMDQLGDRVYRNNEWLYRKAEIYIGSALIWGERVRSWLRDRELTVSSHQAEIDDGIEKALNYSEEAQKIAFALAGDPKNWTWQSSHGSTKHILGEIELLRWWANAEPSDLDKSAAYLTESFEIRRKVNDAQPKQTDWLMNTRWTKVNLNIALAERAKRDGDFGRMRNLYAENVAVIKEALEHDQFGDGWQYELLSNRVSLVGASTGAAGSTPVKDYAELRAEAFKRMNDATLPGARKRWEQLIASINKLSKLVEMKPQ
jgi:hypothetical protein